MRKLALSFAGKGAAPEEEKEETPQGDNSGDTKAVEPKDYGFHVIDQSDRHNILLAEMIRGQLALKQAAKVSTVKYSTGLIFREIDSRIKDLAKSDGNDTSVEVFKKTKKDIQLYENTCKKVARASKNILRVMVSVDVCGKVVVLKMNLHISFLFIYICF